MQEIVKYQDENGALVQFSAQDVKAYICPTITDSELALVMALCQQQGLNPFTKDVYVIKYGNAPASIVTGKEVFTKRANANKAYQGFEAGVTFINARGEVCHREGAAVYQAAKETLVGGWCRVFVEGRKPFYDEVTLDEYQLKDKDGKPKSGWAKMPATMIRKVALVHCLREAFPDQFQGLYCSEEMGKAGEGAAAAEAAPAPAKAAPVEVVAEVVEEEEPPQRSLGLLCGMLERYANMCGRTYEEAVEAVIATRTVQAWGVSELCELSGEQVATACEMVQSWIDKRSK